MRRILLLLSLYQAPSSGSCGDSLSESLKSIASMKPSGVGLLPFVLRQSLWTSKFSGFLSGTKKKHSVPVLIFCSHIWHNSPTSLVVATKILESSTNGGSGEVALILKLAITTKIKLSAMVFLVDFIKSLH